MLRAQIFHIVTFILICMYRGDKEKLRELGFCILEKSSLGRPRGVKKKKKKGLEGNSLSRSIVIGQGVTGVY